MAQNMSGTFKEYPGVVTYEAADGHLRECSPTFLPKMQEWTYVTAWAGCAANCPCCNSSEQDDYCGDDHGDDGYGYYG